MKFKILTLFPEMYPGPIKYSIIGKALSKNIFSIETINIRKFSKLKSKSVDDKPFGGGAGMIIKPDILQSALDSIKRSKNSKIIYFSPRGKLLKQACSKDLIKYDELILICGRYEGIDERFLIHNNIHELSVGDYVLSGGEIASFILIDTCVRLIPEVLGNKNSLEFESFERHLLEYPQYTKPFEWNKIKVPDILISGNHSKISKWREKKAIEKTKKTRPDLWKLYKSNEREKK